MGIGTRSKSHHGDGIGQEQSYLRVTIDSSTNEKGTSTSGNDNSNQINNSVNSQNPATLSINPSVSERRISKQSKVDLQQQNSEDATGSSGCVISTTAASATGTSGNTGTNSANTATGNNTSSNTSMILVTRTRGVKRPKRDPSPPGSPVKKVEVKTATPEAKKRQWELWTVDEKSTFFQALNECGRDFDAIQNNFAQKYKKKGAPAIMIKNKEQVRHFYYRTWHKISKYIEMKDGIKKHALEVYGLIHYGEMRKRLGGMLADKNLHKLNEFIQEGSTLIKIRKKSFRVRTPYCNALKKINNVEDPVEDDDSVCRVPERVTLELNPKNNSAWLHVQEMAQNPRLRMTLKSDQHLSTVMSFLQKKWKPPRLKLKESLNSFDETQKQLVLYPHRSSKCYPVALQAIETQPRPDLKLNNYHANIRAHREKMQSLSGSNENSSDAAMAQSPKLMDIIKDDGCIVTSSLKEPDTSMTVSASDFADITSDNAMFPDDLIGLTRNVAPDKPLQTSSLLSSAEGTCSELSTPCSHNPDQSADISSAMPSSFANTTTTTTITTSIATTTTTTAISTASSTVSAADVGSAEDLEKVKSTLLEQSRKGWTLKEAENLTIAQLFLIFGKEELIRLEYDWSKTSPDSKEELYDCYTIINRLRRLVHLATMEFTDYVKVKAPKSNEKPKSGKSNAGCEVCEACGKILNQSDSKAGNPKLVNKNVNNKTCYLQTKNETACKESVGNLENTAKDKKDAKTDPIPDKKDVKVLDDSQRVDGVFRVPVIPGRGPLSQTLVPNEYINSYRRPRYRRKLQRSARKPVFFQRTFLPKENPRMMTLALLPTATPVTVEASFLPLNNRTNAVITPRTVPSFSNTYTTQILTQPIASTLSVHNPNNTIIVQGHVPQQAVGITVATTTTATVIGTTNTAVTTVTNSFNTVKTAVVISPSLPPPPPSLPVESNLLSLKLSSIRTTSSPTVSELTGTSPDMISMLNVNTNSTDATPLSTTSNAVSSPPNISTLFDISLSDVPMSILEGSDSKGPSTDSGLVTPPLHSEYKLQTSPYNSPFKFNSDNSWMLGEMNDISLGSLLNESPIKKGTTSDLQATNITSNSSSSSSSISSSLNLNNLFNDWSRDSSTSRMDLDTTLQMIMNENSMDYVTKFAELAEKVAASDVNISRNTAATTAVLTAKNSAESNDANAQDNVHCTNTIDCVTQLSDNFP